MRLEGVRRVPGMRRDCIIVVEFKPREANVLAGVRILDMAAEYPRWYDYEAPAKC